MAKTFDEVMRTLRSLGTESRWRLNVKNGAGSNQFGVGFGQLRTLAKDINTDHAMAMKLWETGNIDAMLLASMIMDATLLPQEQAEKMAAPLTYSPLIDELAFSALAKAPYQEQLILKWIYSPAATLGRICWNLLVDVISEKKPLPLPIDEILSYIENKMKEAAKPKQEAMNHCLCEIGIRMPEYTERCIAIGMKLGRLDDRPIPKGCASSYAPEWIAAGIKLREKQKGYT